MLSIVLTMTLRELQYLVALADHAHFGRAAEACHVSQPTLSTQLKKLEDSLGATLFERTNKALKVTPLGAEIVERARQMLASADAIVTLAREDMDPLTGPLRLGIIPSLSPYLLPWFLPPLQAAYPNLQLIVHEDLTDNLTDALRQHRIDAALIALPAADDDLESMALFDEPFRLACPNGHPLASASEINLHDLQRSDLLLLTDGHCLRDQALDVCGFARGAAVEDGTDFRATSLETIRQMVAAGMGITLLPVLALGARDEEAFTVRALAHDASRRMGLVWRKTYAKKPDLERLAGLLRENLPTSVTRVE
jgi:LysR family hydrogen peroxide-inducible transcriptional activator